MSDYVGAGPPKGTGESSDLVCSTSLEKKVFGTSVFGVFFSPMILFNKKFDVYSMH